MHRPREDASGLHQRTHQRIFTGAVAAYRLLPAILLLVPAVVAAHAAETARVASSVASGQSQHVVAIETSVSRPETLPSLRDAPVPPPGPVAVLLPEVESPRMATAANTVDDAVQLSPAQTSSTPAPLLVFSGISGAAAGGTTPPDTVGAVGATQYVEVVNLAVSVFDKATQGVVVAAKPTKTLWASYTGTNAGNGCSTRNDGDAIVVYDKAADRWIISQFSLPNPSINTGPSFQCVAVSQTSDASGAYSLYDFRYNHAVNNTPKMSVWPDAYYTTFDMLDGTFTFVGTDLCAYDRAAMLSGGPATQYCVQLSSSAGASILPADLDGSNAPPAGAPNYLLALGTNSLNLWKFHIDWTTIANSTLTGPINIPVASFTQACAATGGTCIPQTATAQKLDSVGDRLMFRVAYRNFGDHESLVASHSVQAGAVTGVRWYELRSPGSTPVVYQQSTFTLADTVYRWMPSIAMDHQGNIALGYSASDGITVYPSIRYTGRLASDALSSMETEVSMFVGTHSATATNRWGDYSAMTIDPVDDCTFWYANEYNIASTFGAWGTQIGLFAFPTCGPTSAPVIDEVFGAALIALGGTTSLTFTISNTNTGPQLTGLAFDDTLPAGLAAVSTNSNTCDGDLTVSSGEIVLANATLAGMASCVISIEVQGVAPGAQDNDVTIASTEGGSGTPAHATLTVDKADTTTLLSSECMTTFVQGQPFTMSAAVTGVGATGSVDFDDGIGAILCGGITLDAGSASCSTNSLAVPGGSFQQTYLLGANYSGDVGNNASAANTLAITVLAQTDVPFRNGFEDVPPSCPSL